MPLPPLFSTSKVAASMMGGHENPEGITTIRLPKGVISTASAAKSSDTPQSWSSAELSSIQRSSGGWPHPATVQLLQGIGVVELLEQDDRPTFIIDLNDKANFSSDPLRILFANAALRAKPAVLELLQPDTAESVLNPELSGFKTWAVSLVRDKAGANEGSSSITYAGLLWTFLTLRRRFRVIHGNNSTALVSPTPQGAQPPPTLDLRLSVPLTGTESGTPGSGYFGASGQAPVCTNPEVRSGKGSNAATPVRVFDDLVLTPSPLYTTFDWTRIPLDDPSLGAHHRFARSVDWASTPLGPLESWPPELRIMSNMIMGSPHPAAMYWGQDYIAIYNEAYVPLAGKKHPQLMGARCQDAWPEIWDEISPLFDAAWHNGCATMKHDDSLFLTRNGFLEETFFNWAVIPLVGSDGSVVALYNPAFENTRRRINERMMLTLREVGIKTSQVRDVKTFWSQLQKALEHNELDVPFALIYSVGEYGDSDVASTASGAVANPPHTVLEGSIGVPDGHPCAVSSIDLRSSDEGFAPYMRESMTHTANGPVILSEEDGTLPTALIQGLCWKGFGDPCRTIVVFPVQYPTTAGEAVVGFIVLGVNPRRRYDEDYQLFVSLLSRQLATSLASVVLLEEEIRRGQKAARLAALDRQELSKQLHLRTQEAVESEYRFARMAEFGPVGLFIADGHGTITYCNEMFYEISGLERDTSTLTAWMQSIRDEDRVGADAAWRRVVEDKTAVTHEFRFKGSRELMDGHSVDIWGLMSAYPEKDDAGELKSIFGCITDISQQKWAEDFQKQRREEAVELKRQQENFIDITSHEMRNPLSAILQCADEIAASLSRYRQGEAWAHSPGTLSTLLDSCIEAANTISLCASHQKRIVDDILTLSKLDSNLLLVTPVDVQPVRVVQDVLKMFETELNSNAIEGHFCIEQSYRDLAVDWVKLDPSRLRQVLINLMTNAIKFTQGRPTRSIVISLGASTDVGDHGLSYIPPKQPDQGDPTDDADWADGEKINLHFAVTDTGPGLDDDEKQVLFQRFTQASPRTHVQYGGSGLGLFICRILTELQGGQIGVESQKGQGSTFAFYIKGRKSNQAPVSPPADTPVSAESPPSALRSASAVLSQSITRHSSPAREPVQLPPPLSPSRDSNKKAIDVLIVEDNLVNQKVLQRQLRLSGNNIYVANHGGEALAELRRSRFWNESAARLSTPLWLSSRELGSEGGALEENKRNISVILMDLEMPVMDGISCTREIRRLEEEGVITHHIPIIAVTAYARPEQVQSAKAAGVDDMISKPFRLSELIPKIEELVAKYNMLP
ncbi:hypothetical protein VTK56DRAFT_607 [Thermocarpiscus australiensis]